MYKELENKLKETSKLFVFCRIEDILVNGEGKIHLILSKDNPDLILDIIKIIKKYFVGKDVTLMFNYLIPNIKEKEKKLVEKALKLIHGE